MAQGAPAAREGTAAPALSHRTCAQHGSVRTPTVVEGRRSFLWPALGGEPLWEEWPDADVFLRHTIEPTSV
jgi:hypothetical protein